MKRLPIYAACREVGATGERPCPHSECRYHLPDGKLKRETTSWAETAPTCALDVANNGPHTQQYVAECMGLSVKVIKDIEKRAYERGKKNAIALGVEPSGD